MGKSDGVVKKCIEENCEENAESSHSHYWCQKHDDERINKITKQMNNFLKGFDKNGI